MIDARLSDCHSIEKLLKTRNALKSIVTAEIRRKTSDCEAELPCRNFETGSYVDKLSRVHAIEESQKLLLS